MCIPVYPSWPWIKCQIDRKTKSSELSSKTTPYPIEDLPDPHPLRGLADTAIEHVVQGDLFVVPGYLWPLRDLCLLLVLVCLIVQRWIHGDGLLWSLHVG